MKYELSPSLSVHDKDKIKQSGILKALEDGDCGDYLPTSEDNPHQGNKNLDNKIGLFHFHLVKKNERKSKANPNGKESDEIIVYIKLENSIYIVRIATHNLFRNAGDGIKNILSIIEREKPLYLGNNPTYKFFINQDVKSTNMEFVNLNSNDICDIWNMVLEFESAVLYCLTEDLKNFNIHRAIALTNNIDEKKLEYLQKVVNNFEFKYCYNHHVEGSLIMPYNKDILKRKFQNIIFKDSCDLYKQIIDTKITYSDYYYFFKEITKKNAPVLFKSTKNLKDNTDENIMALLKSNKINFKL
jgi:hypothetical protein